MDLTDQQLQLAYEFLGLNHDVSVREVLARLDDDEVMAAFGHWAKLHYRHIYDEMCTQTVEQVLAELLKEGLVTVGLVPRPDGTFLELWSLTKTGRDVVGSLSAIEGGDDASSGPTGHGGNGKGRRF
jgi:hypothetical protein